MNKIEDMISATKLNEILQKRDDDKIKKTILWILAIVGAVVAIAGIAYAVYRFFTPDYLEDFDEEFEDDFEDDYFEEEDV
jgi:flagellar basal body-associated protein FliL